MWLHAAVPVRMPEAAHEPEDGSGWKDPQRYPNGHNERNRDKRGDPFIGREVQQCAKTHGHGSADECDPQLTTTADEPTVTVRAVA